MCISKPIQWSRPSMATFYYYWYFGDVRCQERPPRLPSDTRSVWRIRLPRAAYTHGQICRLETHFGPVVFTWCDAVHRVHVRRTRDHLFMGTALFTVHRSSPEYGTQPACSHSSNKVDFGVMCTWICACVPAVRTRLSTTLVLPMRTVSLS